MTFHTGGQFTASLNLLLGALLTLSTTIALAQGDGIGKAKFTTDQGVSNFSAKATTIPYFRSSFTDPTRKGPPFTMVERSFGKYNHHCTHCDHPFPVYLCVVI
jgi:hypothetical protein